MKRAIFGVLILILLPLQGCATARPGIDDKLIVRAEDVEVNSLALYRAVIAGFHMKHSQEESPEVYAALEVVRKNFPKAWLSLHAAIPRYKVLKDRTDLETILTEIQGYCDDMKKAWRPKLAGEVP